MARINFEEHWWTDPRRARLIKLFAGESYMADGLAAAAWRLAQDYWKNGKRPIPKDKWEGLEASSKLVEAGLSRVEADGTYMLGSEDSFTWLIEKREAGAEGGKKSAKARLKKSGSAQPSRQKPRSTAEAPPKQTQPSPSPSSSFSSSSSSSPYLQNEEISPPAALAVVGGITGETWEAYSEAYRARHGTQPVRNAAVNGQLAQFVKRLGGEAAPAVAAFYVGHNDRFYVQALHSVGLMLRDAEKLHTEWVTGRRMTNTDAIQVDKRQAIYNAFAPLIAEAQARERGEK